MAVKILVLLVLHEDEVEVGILTLRFSMRMIPFSLGLAANTQQQQRRPFLRRKLSMS